MMMHRPIHLGLELASTQANRSSTAQKGKRPFCFEEREQSTRARGSEFPLAASSLRWFRAWHDGIVGGVQLAFKVSNEYDFGKGRKRRKLFVEVERCVGLTCKRGLTKDYQMNGPFIVIRLNGRKVGRTPPIKLSKGRIGTWFDETYEFDICNDCQFLTFEA